ncbi:hypothetical protein, partial [Stutzerimonas xanthomarina]|uniref:hypothetical protein n=1 Tax=Stutzerimonas xanthomarina TaxID=271420 RepID=UPI001C8C643D
GNKISNPPWVKFQSAGWVNFPSAPTTMSKGCDYETVIVPCFDHPAVRRKMRDLHYFGGY